THALIRELGRERAVLLSTHILSDVEALSGRVVIVDRGRVKESGTPAALRERLGAASLDEVFAKVTAS
ncbi:MAG TPA: ABC transporter ATP-binding protein, partial [Polyangia bacterium]|nr:ABC transporter ATP-binding protein [Polyangia bacterium]